MISFNKDNEQEPSAVDYEERITQMMERTEEGFWNDAFSVDEYGNDYDDPNWETNHARDKRHQEAVLGTLFEVKN